MNADGSKTKRRDKAKQLRAMKYGKQIRKEYKDYLLDWRWVEFSNEFIERNGNECWFCAESDELLVHHLRYRNIKPWEYDDDELRVLCRSCHNSLHGALNDIWMELLRFSPAQLECLLKRVRTVDRVQNPFPNFVRELANQLTADVSD